jgi:hypothetical protein
MISAFLSIGYVASIKMFETYVLAWWMAMFFLIGLPVIFLLFGFLFWTVFVSSISPIRNGASNRLSDIILVPHDDDRRRLKFPKGKTALEKEKRAEFLLITPSRSEISTEGIRHSKAITFSGKMSCPYYILNFPFLGTLCKLLIFGFFWEYKGWGLGGLNLAWLWMPTLGDENDPTRITVNFCEDGIEEEKMEYGTEEGKMPVQTAHDSVQPDSKRPIVTGKLVVVDDSVEKNPPFFSRLLPWTRDFWRERIFHCVHYDEKGASVYIVHAWRLKLFHPLRWGIFTSRFTHGAHWMMNADGTISPLKNAKLVLGIHPNIKHARQRTTPTSAALKPFLTGLLFLRPPDTDNDQVSPFLVSTAQRRGCGSDHHLVPWSHPRQAVTPLRPFFPPVACYRSRLTEGTRHRGPVLVGSHELLRSFSRCREESRSRTG